jgi:hypothetical protein
MTAIEPVRLLIGFHLPGKLLPSPAPCCLHLLLALALTLSLGIPARADTGDATSDSPIKQRAAEFRLSLEYLSLPGDETMGMVGAAYLLEVVPGLYIGPSAYGAVSGKRGGFFTGGGEIAYRKALFSRCEIEAGFYVGGGGGGTALVGSGLMLRPHVDLTWSFGSVRAGVSASSVRFPDGEIQSNQIGLVLAFDDRFFYTDANRVGEATKTDTRGGVGFDRVAVLAGTYRPRPGVTDNSGRPATGHIGLAGFRAEQSFDEYLRWGIEAAAAARGSADGYAEVLGTLALELEAIPDRLSFGGRLAVGMGGGGAVSTGGGVLAKASLYATAPLTRDLYVTLEGGYVDALSGEFRALFGTLQIGMELDHPHRGSSYATIEGWQWSGSVQHYSSAARRDGSSDSLDLVGFKIDRQLSGGVYLSAQAHSAVAGGAGGFSVGLAGGGWETPHSAMGLFAGLELMIGAAGGGGVETNGGAIAQPMAYAGIDIGQGWSLRGGVGYIHSFKGSVDSTVLDLSVGYAFGSPTR